MPDLLLLATVFFAFFTLSLTGFGHALIAMPLLGPLLGIPVAAPLVALLSLTGEALMILRYRAQFNPRIVWRLIAAALVGILISVRLVALLDERVVLALLGLVTGGYALYALLDLRLPHLTGRNWAFPFGFVSGLLSGAYNTGGPPAVIYASLARWPPAEFKMRLQSLFITSTITVGRRTWSAAT